MAESVLDEPPPPYQLVEELDVPLHTEDSPEGSNSLPSTSSTTYSPSQLIEPVSYQRPSSSTSILPDYPSPVNFKIGSRQVTRALVTVRQLQVHLDVLRAFKNLRIKVEQGSNAFPQIANALNAEKRWRWFLELAVERFVSPNSIYSPLIYLGSVAGSRIRTFPPGSISLFMKYLPWMSSWFGILTC